MSGTLQTLVRKLGSVAVSCNLVPPVDTDGLLVMRISSEGFDDCSCSSSVRNDVASLKALLADLNPKFAQLLNETRQAVEGSIDHSVIHKR